MSKISPPNSTHVDLCLASLRDPARPVQSNLNYYLSTISSYIPDRQPISWLKAPLSWLCTAINALFRFTYGVPEALKLNEAYKLTSKKLYTYPPQDLADRSTLTAVFKETKQALDQGFYTLPEDGIKITIDLEPMKKGTKMWKDDETLKAAIDFSSLPTYKTTICETLDTDTVLAGLKLLEEGLNPLLLNMANRSSPGGGVTSGCLAQEEELCRKTALYASINPDDNPYLVAQISQNYYVPEHGCHYSPYVPVIRERKEDHFAWLRENPKLCFVSSAAYNLNPRHQDPAVPKGKPFEEGMRKKLRSQIFCALVHGHDSLVLGAFGCGAFCQDPEQVSQWYLEELAPYKHYFKKICFGVLVARDSDKPNLAAFLKRFS